MPPLSIRQVSLRQATKQRSRRSNGSRSRPIRGHAISGDSLGNWTCKFGWRLWADESDDHSHDQRGRKEFGKYLEATVTGLNYVHLPYSWIVNLLQKSATKIIFKSFSTYLVLISKLLIWSQWTCDWCTAGFNKNHWAGLRSMNMWRLAFNGSSLNSPPPPLFCIRSPIGFSLGFRGHLVVSCYERLAV